MQRPAPPTIADLRAESVQGARVWCLIATAGRDASSPGIGAREVQVMPDWPPYLASS